MSSRDSWIPLAAGLVVGAGLLVLLYKMFSGTSYSKVNLNPSSKAYYCTCKKGDIDSIVSYILISTDLIAAGTY